MNLAPALLYPAVHWMDETQTSTSDQSGVGVCLLYFVRLCFLPTSDASAPLMQKLNRHKKTARYYYRAVLYFRQTQKSNI